MEFGNREEPRVSAPTPELNLLIFVKGSYCQVSQVEGLSFNSCLSGQPYTPYSKGIYASAAATVTRDDTRSYVPHLSCFIPCFFNFLHLISESPFQTCLY